MASTLTELQAVLQPTEAGAGGIRVMGNSYNTTDAGLKSFADALAHSSEFLEDWPSFLAILNEDSLQTESAMADARLLMLYAHYVVVARTSADAGVQLPMGMMTWLGKGESRIPAEHSVWFLLQTDGIGSEAARDVINVLGGETTFLGSFLGDDPDPEVLEQAGIYLAMLLHLRLKWPEYYTWMGMDARMRSTRELFLMGSDELPIVHQKDKHVAIPEELIDVYDILSKTMYQVEFFLLLRIYAEHLRASKGKLSPEVLAIRERLMAD